MNTPSHVEVVNRLRQHKEKKEEWMKERERLRNELSILLGKTTGIEWCRKKMASNIYGLQKILNLPMQLALPKKESESSQSAPSDSEKQIETAKPETETELMKPETETKLPEPEVKPEPKESGQATVKRGKRPLKGKAKKSAAPVSTDAYSFKPKHALSIHLDSIRAVCFYNSKPLLVSASDEGTIRITNLEPKAQSAPSKKKKAHSPAAPPANICSLRGHGSPVLSLHPFEWDNAQWLLSGALNGTISVWQLPDATSNLYDCHGHCTHHRHYEYSFHNDAVWSLTVLHDLHTAVSCSADGTAKIWNIETGSVCDLSLRSKPICCRVIKDKQFAVGCESGSVEIFDGDSPLSSIELPAMVTSLCVTSDASQLVAACADNIIRIVDLSDASVAGEFCAHESGVAGLAMTRDGFLVTVAHDGLLRAWRMGSFEKVDEQQLHKMKYGEGALCVAATTEACAKAYIASGGADGVLSVYFKA